MLRLLGEFRKDQRGMALVLVAIMLPVIVGFALLVIDGSRASNLHNDLQKAADSFALAAAAELDGRSDALTRADRALTNLVDNTHRFSITGSQTLMTFPGSVTRQYLRSLPANDWLPIIAANVTTDPADAQFVEVTVNPTGFSSIFPASFLTGNAADNSFNVAASAVAGFAGVVTCDMTPLFICNPFPGQNLQDVANNQNFYRKGIKLVMGSTSWGPGNVGFLRPESDHGYGEGDLADDIARVSFPECVNNRGIFTQTGNLTEKVRAALNTRFDMYGPHFRKTDASVPPAPNIRKGYDFKPRNPHTPGTDACDMVPGTDPTKFHGLTQDLTYPSFDGRIGDGKWDFEGYRDANYPDGELTGFVAEDGSEFTNDNPPSRYDLYKYELTHEPSLVPEPSVGLETGEPACHATPSEDPDRRLIYAAIVDCDLYEDQLNGQSGTLQAMAFASFFLTEPVVDDEIRAEIVDIDGNMGRGTMNFFAKDNVQLYR